MFIEGGKKRDSSVGAAHPSEASDAAPTELARFGNERAIDMPRLWRSRAAFRYTPYREDIAAMMPMRMSTASTVSAIFTQLNGCLPAMAPV